MVDRTGTFLGSLWESMTNMGAVLLGAGLAKLQTNFGADRIADSQILAHADQSAKLQKLRIWENYVEGQENTNGPSAESKEKEVLKVVVTEVLGGGQFYVQKVGDQNVVAIQNQLASLNLGEAPLLGSFNPKKGDIVLAQFSLDKSWNRVLGSGKDLFKRRENTDKEELAKKAMTIIEFLKPTKGKRCHGRGRGPFRGGFDSNLSIYQSSPSIEDPTQFQTLAVNKSLIVSSNCVADHINTNLAEHQMSGSLQCPSCSYKFEQKPDWLGLPAGVKFDPTDQQLIEHLEAKVSTHGLSSHPLIDEFILTIEGEDGICYTHPEKLPGVTKDGLSKHFFHRPSMAYTTGTKIQMTEVNIEQGETRWHKTGKTKPVIVKGEQKGCKKIMVLYTNPGKNRKPEKTNWVMHQYHLGAKIEDEKEGEFVVSKIFYQTQPRQTNCSALVGRVGEGAGEKDRS